MISIDTYISILFAIIIAALLGASITIFTQNLSHLQKRKMTLIVLAITLSLIIIASIIYFYGKFNLHISLSLPKFSTFNISLLPFSNLQFTNSSFCKSFQISICISIVLFIIMYIIMYWFDNILFDVKHLIITTLIALSIVSFLRIWEIYIFTITFFSHIPAWLSYFLQSLLYLFITLFELFVLSEENSHYLLKDIPESELEAIKNKLQDALDKSQHK